MLLPDIPPIKSITDLRYRTAELIRFLQKEKKPVILTRGANAFGILFPLEYYKSLQKAMKNYEDYEDAMLLEREITSASFEGAIDFEEYVKKRFGKDYVSDYLAKKAKEVSR